VPQGSSKIGLRQAVVYSPILSSSVMSFELHDKTAEETDPAKCNFRNFGRSVTLTLDRVEVTLVRITWWRSTHTPN